MKTYLFLSMAFLMTAKAELESTNQVTISNTNSITPEQRLLSAIPELTWSQVRFIKEGWMKEGQKVMPKANTFSKNGTLRFGIIGEDTFFFQSKRLGLYTFYIRENQVGENYYDSDWLSLYKATTLFCHSKEMRSGDSTRSEITWTVGGSTNDYVVKLCRRISALNAIERSLEVSITPKKN